jgi:hypothetical protein
MVPLEPPLSLQFTLLRRHEDHCIWYPPDLPKLPISHMYWLSNKFLALCLSFLRAAVKRVKTHIRMQHNCSGR